MLNFVGQHHTGGISYKSINNNGYFQWIYALCKYTISFTNFTSFFQNAEMWNSHMYKFPQNNLYSNNIIADSLRKIHISENREKITVQRLIYQRVNKFYGSKKMESYHWEKKNVISDPLSPHSKDLYLWQLKNNQKQMNTTRGQNLKEFNNTAGLLSVFL